MVVKEQKNQISLYFETSLYRCFSTDLDKIYVILKAFFQLFQMPPTASLGLFLFRSFKQLKLMVSGSLTHNNW